jgi:hypothetical protein
MQKLSLYNADHSDLHKTIIIDESNVKRFGIFLFNLNIAYYNK